MDIKHLELLRALVEDPHLTRVAARFHITQSALSKRIQALEAEVGRELFERRGPRGMRPLPEALELAKVSERVLSTWNTGLRKIHRLKEEPEHFVLVGPPLFLREIILPWWVKNAKHFPERELEVKISALSRVSLETIRGDADAGILEHRDELADFICKPMYRETWGVIRHPQSTGKELKDLRWGTYSTSNNPVETYLVKRGRMPVPSYHTYWEDLTALAIWVSDTPGAASVIPWHAAAWLEKRKRLVFEPIGKDAMTLLYLAYPKDSPHKKLIHALLQAGSEIQYE